MIDKIRYIVNQEDGVWRFDKEEAEHGGRNRTRSHHHHDHDDVELNPATWRDPKRYAWLLGLIVPLAPFLAWGSSTLTGFGGFWFLGPVLVFGVFPLLDIAIGVDADATRPTACSSGSSRTATTAGAPTSSSRSSTPG